MSTIRNLDDLMLHQLKDLYDAESEILKALPKMVKRAQSSRLKQAFESHLKETERQKERLEQAFEQLGKKASKSKCKGIRGILEEGEELIQELEDGAMDAGLVSAAQRVEHYEMAAYGSARAYARQLGHRKVAELLEKSLNEESKADEKLSQLAESELNREAETAHR